MKKGLAVVLILALFIVLSVLNGNLWTGANARTSDDTPTPTVFCPAPTSEPFYVDPLTSPTKQDQQDIIVYLGNGEVITVSLESGVYTNTSSSWPATVNVALLENITHHLQV